MLWYMELIASCLAVPVFAWVVVICVKNAFLLEVVVIVPIVSF